MGAIGPKSKLGRARTHSRRANWKLEAPTLGVCPRCRQPKYPHRVCGNCGYYNGRQVIEVNADNK
ncbi:MAG: 50S ribosomal protein L32 [Eubacteriales bacterium]|nr:50S ribosomal protein L32 [Eubacteriales bacterium]